jgi:hypothetical protein
VCGLLAGCLGLNCLSQYDRSIADGVNALTLSMI